MFGWREGCNRKRSLEREGGAVFMGSGWGEEKEGRGYDREGRWGVGRG